MGVVYFSIIPTFEPSRYCKCWIVCFYHRKLVTHMNATRDLYRGYQWSLRPWNKNFTPSWDNEGFTRQRENEEYEPRQLDYDTGLPIKEAVRSKYLYEMGGEL